jgi:DNA-binding response OmpR family regulator
LRRAGYASVAVERPLAVFDVAGKLRWDAACIDASPLGDETRAMLRGLGGPAPLLGLGVEGVTVSLPLPLNGSRLVESLASALAVATPVAGPLRLDEARRVAMAHGQEATLTRTEFRLLSFLLEQRGREAPLNELLASVWGFTEGRGGSVLVRAHVRNLRAKLARIGLPDAVHSRRGRGYALVV